MGETGFCCPLCGQALAKHKNVAGCVNGHSFDIARQGYLHLLPPNKMHSKLPGDSKEMVEGRRAFLEAGYYAPFREELCRLVKIAAEDTETPVILDAGCGEGYYTQGVKEVLPQSEIYGYDISKLAVKAAAGKYKEISFAVASSFSVPFASDGCDCLINIFSPMAQKEFARVVKPRGKMILAVPGARHLFGMKEILYEAPYENEHRETNYEGFTFVQRTEIRRTITVPDAVTAQQLFAMTPYYWKTDVRGGERLRETKGFETEIEFDFIVYNRNY